jgi:hypothetical protein
MTNKTLLISLLLVTSFQSNVAKAHWIDDPAVASVRGELIEWEARFIDAVQKPEIDVVKKLKVKPKTTDEEEDGKVDSQLKTQLQPCDPVNEKAGNCETFRYRNFPRYLAKVAYAEQQLNRAKSLYDKSLADVHEQNSAYVDLDYRENSGLEHAQEVWQKIVAEVGLATVNQAQSQYGGQEETLKSLTTYKK